MLGIRSGIRNAAADERAVMRNMRLKRFLLRRLRRQCETETGPPRHLTPEFSDLNSTVEISVVSSKVNPTDGSGVLQVAF